MCRNQQTSTHSLLAWHTWVEIRQMAVIRLVQFPERQGVIPWLETRTTVAKVYLKSTGVQDFGGAANDQDLCNRTKLGNEDYQKSTHRGKLQTEQVNVGAATRVLATPEKGSSELQIHSRYLVAASTTNWSPCARNNCTSHNKENVEFVEDTAVLRRGFSGGVNAEEFSSSSKPGPRGDPG